MSRTWMLIVASLLLWSALHSTVRADAIDGHWCHKDGRRMLIEGSNIVTPGGTDMQGDYDRHGFAYTAPSGEAHAGKQITIDLVSEDIIHLYLPPTSGDAAQSRDIETWQRCELTM